MKKVMFFLLTVFVLSLTSCNPESVDEENPQLVDKDKNVRPGNQGNGG